MPAEAVKSVVALVFHLYSSPVPVQHFFIHETEAQCRQDIFVLQHNKTPTQVMLEAQIIPEPVQSIEYSCITFDEAWDRQTGGGTKAPSDAEPNEQ
jgi:hypothetical protein